MNDSPVRRRAMVLGLVASCILVATAAPIAGAESTLQRVNDQGYIRMGFANEIPFSYTTPRASSPVSTWTS